MAKDWSKAFYNSKAWQDCRRAYLSEHPYCERCKAAGRIAPAEHVHHKVWLNQNNIGDPNITLNPDNKEADIELFKEGGIFHGKGEENVRKTAKCRK